MPTTTDPISVRGGVARLLEWLTRHPGLPVIYTAYVDDASAELQLQAGSFEALSAAAEVADALDGAVITAHDPLGKPSTELTINGIVGAGRPDSLDLVASITVYNTARVRLLAALGVPALPTERTWFVTAERLRGLVEAASAPAGA